MIDLFANSPVARITLLIALFAVVGIGLPTFFLIFGGTGLLVAVAVWRHWSGLLPPGARRR